MIVDAPLQFPELCRFQVLGETDVTRKLVEILRVVRPGARFRGYVASREAADADHLLVADLLVPGAAATLRERDDPRLIIMPLPIGDIWSYWSLAPYVLHKVQLGPPLQMPEADLLQVMVEIDRAHVDPETGALHTPPDAFLYQKTDWLAPGLPRIMQVFERLSDPESVEVYKLLIAGRPPTHWAHYLGRVFRTVQYFEALDYSRCQVVINGGVFAAEELPLQVGHLPEGAEVHCVDPQGFDHVDPYVRPWIEAGLQRFVEHRVALDRQDGTLALKTDVMGQLSVNASSAEQVYPARSIDSLVQSQGLQRVDLIKLDLEGGDMPAVLGAARTIQRFRPQLALSIYHVISDFWEIPRVIFQLCPDYDFYIRNYSCERWETILYGIPKELNPVRQAA